MRSIRRSGAVAGESRNKLDNSDFFCRDIIKASCRQHPALRGYQVATRGVQWGPRDWYKSAAVIFSFINHFLILP
jgi:hypothetical protein